MAFNFTLPFTKKRADVEHEAMQETPAAAAVSPPKRGSGSAPLKHGRKLPLIGGLPALRQIQILGAVIFLLFVFDAFWVANAVPGNYPGGTANPARQCCCLQRDGCGAR